MSDDDGGGEGVSIYSVTAAAIDDAFDALEWEAAAYTTVAKTGALALLPIALGSLAAIARAMGGA